MVAYCCVTCRFSANNAKRGPATMSATISEQDKEIMKMRAYKVAAEDMGVRQ